MSRTREAALNYGCNPRDWPEAEQRAAVAELFVRDEQQKFPTWIGDALSEHIGADRQKRLEIIALLGEINTSRRLFSLGALLDDALRDYPLDKIGEECALYIGEWRDGERRSAARLEADSLNKHARECA